MRSLTTDYRIDADKRSFASAGIRVIRGFILRTAEGRKVELGTQEFKNGALEEALRLQLQGLRTFRKSLGLDGICPTPRVRLGSKSLMTMNKEQLELSAVSAAGEGLGSQ